MAKVAAGRKRHSPIWDYFEYDPLIDKSKCIVMRTDGNICGMQLKGKNPTNLKVHLRSSHRDAHEKFTAREKKAASPQSDSCPASRAPQTQQTLPQCLAQDSTWCATTQEHHKREQAMVEMFIDTGLSTRLCANSSFKEFCRMLEHRFKAPGSARVNSLIGAKMKTATEKLKDIVREARRLTLCVDGWSKRGLTAAFLGISACFYHPPTGKARHVLLNLHRLDHPHTGESIARCIDLTLETWGISEDKVLLVVTDKGSNIVKAVRLLRERGGQVEDPHGTDHSMDTEAEDTDTETSDTEIEENESGKDIYLVNLKQATFTRR